MGRKGPSDWMAKDGAGLQALREREVTMSEPKNELKETFWESDQCGYTFKADSLPEI